MPAVDDPNVQHPKKRKKPPACDQCKARRVLCHPQPPNIPCPRCAEKGVKCTTTPVVRGRPPKRPHASTSALSPISPAIADSPKSGASTPSVEYDLIVKRRSPDVPPKLELSPELVRHLFDCFAQLPQTTHPAFRREILKSNLATLSWKIDLLPPQQRVLAYCIMALSACTSFHPTIIGPGTQPTSFTDRSIFFRGGDLRGYGIRRGPVCRELHARAYRLACEFGVMLEVSEDNTMSCFILEYLSRQTESSSRPWASAYVSHTRAMAPTWDFSTHSAGSWEAAWIGFLMAEALAATGVRKPVLFTRNDQLLMTSAEPPSLTQLIESFQTTLQQTADTRLPHIAFRIILPFAYHVAHLARELSETITGDYARRSALSDSAVTRFLASLTTLQAFRALVFTQLGPDLELQPDPPEQRADGSKSSPSDARTHNVNVNVRACAAAMALGDTALVLALYQEMEYRAAPPAPPLAPISPPAASANPSLQPTAGLVHPTQAQMNTVCGPPPPQIPPQNQWSQERLTLLRQQVHELARLAAVDVGRALTYLPSLPHLTHLQWNNLPGWAQFCLDEADAAGGIPAESMEVFDRILNGLKLHAYSWDSPRSSGLIDRMEAYMAARRASTSFMSSASSYVDPAIMCDVFFPSFDMPWMGIFGVATGDGLHPGDVSRYLFQHFLHGISGTLRYFSHFLGFRGIGGLHLVPAAM
ncbi:hypothetical protein B0H11DRAFT_2209656 [Mycena galericulata]|nr:hypothetical protein B0H11DRAFT_2209656 [Mycena galericulata]